MCSVLHIIAGRQAMDVREIGFLIKSINDKIKVSADANLRENGLTFGQCRILGFLHDKGGKATQKEIEDAFGIAHPTVVGLVSRLEKSGYLETWFNPSDGRSKFVGMTDKARLMGEEMEGVIREQEARMTAGLSPDDIGELKRLLSVIYKNLS
jgi:DNA-binding MarR family transcriptional regulator